MKYHLEILPIHETNENKRKRQIVENPKGAIVLVHGICHGAWCWENFINFFADRKYQCYAISLPGHGGSEGKERLQEYHLCDYVEAVRDAMEVIKKDMETRCDLRGVKPFLLGHSMGGAVIQQYIGKYEDDVQGAVLFAPATAPQMLPEDVFRFRPLNLSFASIIALYEWNCSFFVHHAAFFTGKNKEGKKCQRVKDTSSYRKLLQKESKKIIGNFAFRIPPFENGDMTKLYSENYKVNIPVFVIGSYADLYFPQDSLEKTASTYASNGKTALVILDRLCHDMMLDDEEWEESAKHVLTFMENPSKFVSDPHKHWPRG